MRLRRSVAAMGARDHPVGAEDQETTAESAEMAADAAASSGLPEERRDPLPRATSSDRLLWAGAAIAVIAHLAPFLYLGEPDPMGDGVLTEAIAVELVDKAVLEGKDQTPASAPVAASPPPQPAPQTQSPPGPPQKPQQAVPPSPPPAPPVAAKPAPELPKAEAMPPPKTLPAFAGEDAAARPKGQVDRKDAKRTEDTKAAEPKQAAKPDETEAKPRAPQPQRPPPQKAVPPQAPPQAQPSVKAAPARDPSLPALAKSGEVSQLAKQVVAALAKAKPSAPGVKGSVTVTVVVAFGGGVRTAKVTGSSGREDLDKLALDAAKKAKLPPPPPDVTTDDLFYDVEYKFE
ncbi:MAG: TonB family protein [Hyphomicrobiaceae bacterium]|nr:TonB family protein [Hyphomicrobiaceae bacterium]